MSVKGIFERVVETVITTAATELSEKLGEAAGMSERSKAQLRRRARRELKTAIGKMTAGVKAVKSKLTAKSPISFDELRLRTACQVLLIPAPKNGKPVDLELARKNKLSAARLNHPDAIGGDASKRDQFQVVIQAFDWLERYNVGVHGKKK